MSAIRKTRRQQHPSSRRSLALSLAAFALTPLALSAQGPCGLAWQPGAPSSGPDSQVRDLVVGINGDLFAGGDFRIADQEFVNRVARWDGTAWHALGAGIADGMVLAMAALGNGSLAVGGQFTAAGGAPARNLALWDGANWNAIGDVGTGSTAVRAMTVLANGDLIIGGLFTQVGSVAAANVARWDGATWSPLGAGLPLVSIAAMQQMPNGDLIVAGTINQVGPLPARGLARWDGSTWSPIVIPGLSANPQIRSMAVLPNGVLALAGAFTIGTVPTRVALWDGVAPVVVNPPLFVANAVGLDGTGALLVGGSNLLGAPVGTVQRFDGTNWTDVGVGMATAVNELALDPNGAVLAAGAHVSRFGGQTWQQLGAAPAPLALVALTMPGGDVVIGGDFHQIGGVAANHIARFDGSTFVPLGSGVDAPVIALGLGPNGDLLVGGNFTNAGGAPASHVARWTGTTWATLGGGIASAPAVILADASGEIVAAGGGINPFVMRYDGASWSSVAAPLSGSTQAAITTPEGDILLGGTFANTLRYQNGVLQPIPGAGTVRGFARSAAGEIVGVGSFPSLSTSVARLSNGTWVAIAGAPTNWTLFRAAFLPNNDLVVTGYIDEVAGVAATGAVRFDGSTWSPLPGIDGAPVRALAASGGGSLFAGGALLTAGPFISVGLARADSTCPASATTFGAGCSGGAGVVTLTRDSLPWTGATFRATAHGIYAPSLAVHVAGVQPTVAPLPMGAPGCFLYTDPLLLQLLVPQGNTVGTELPLPSTPSLAGLTLRTQVAVVELLATGGIVRLASSNALDLTVGAL